MRRNLFKSEHVYKDKEDRTNNVARSLQLLQSDFRGTEHLFMDIKTDVNVSLTPRLCEAWASIALSAEAGPRC